MFISKIELIADQSVKLLRTSEMTYSEAINSEHPGYLVILIDQSYSMSEAFGDAIGGSKAQACADAVNRILREIGLASVKDGVVLNRCDISVIGYGKSGDIVSNAFGGELASQSVVSVGELVKKCLRIENRKLKIPDGAGGYDELEDQLPVWIEANAGGGTPMAEAFEKAYKLIEKWIQNHQASFPPIVINITDGIANDQSGVKHAVSKLTQLSTNDGNTLILNAHISGREASQIEFPSSSHQLPSGDTYAQFLYDISSVFPPMMRQNALDNEFTLNEGAKGFVYNADIKTMIYFLNIGTGSLTSERRVLP